MDLQVEPIAGEDFQAATAISELQYESESASSRVVSEEQSKVPSTKSVIVASLPPKERPAYARVLSRSAALQSEKVANTFPSPMEVIRALDAYKSMVFKAGIDRIHQARPFPEEAVVVSRLSTPKNAITTVVEGSPTREFHLQEELQSAANELGICDEDLLTEPRLLREVLCG